MSNWLREQGCVVELAEVPSVALVAFAQSLPIDAISTRNFEALIAALPPEAPTDAHVIITFVQARDTLHDKFWRYLQLFSDTVSE